MRSILEDRQLADAVRLFLHNRNVEKRLCWQQANATRSCDLLQNGWVLAAPRKALAKKNRASLRRRPTSDLNSTKTRRFVVSGYAWTTHSTRHQPDPRHPICKTSCPDPHLRRGYVGFPCTMCTCSAAYRGLYARITVSILGHNATDPSSETVSMKTL